MAVVITRGPLRITFYLAIPITCSQCKVPPQNKALTHRRERLLQWHLREVGRDWDRPVSTSEMVMALVPNLILRICLGKNNSACEKIYRAIFCVNINCFFVWTSLLQCLTAVLYLPFWESIHDHVDTMDPAECHWSFVHWMSCVPLRKEPWVHIFLFHLTSSWPAIKH